MSENTRIKLNLSTGEIEVEGSEEFVKNQMVCLPELLEKINSKLPKHININKSQTTKIDGEKPLEAPSETQTVSVASGTKSLETKTDIAPNNVLPSTFGEYFNLFPKKLDPKEQVLIAGYYRQKTLQDNLFETKHANKLLLDVNVQLSNPANYTVQLKNDKLIIQLGKRGTIKQFRVSRDGEMRIAELKEQT